MKTSFITAVLLFSISVTKAQTLRKPLAASYTGFGAYSLHHADVFSFTANQASLAQLKNASAGVYGERRFLLSELSNYTAAIGLPTSSGNFGFKAAYSGSTDYNETQLGLAYGRSLGKKIDIGVQFNYNGIRMAQYGNTSAIGFELGTILHVTKQLHAGLHISNPVAGKFGKDHPDSYREEKLSSVYTIGFGFEPSDKFLISAAIEKEEGQPVNVNTGLEYKFIPQLLARVGISSATSSPWMGIGLTIKSFRIDVTSSYHPQLGITPGLMLLFNLKRPGSNSASSNPPTDKQ